MELLIISILLLIVAETSYLTLANGLIKRRTAQRPVFVDTSVLIDGRIIAIAESGFMMRPLYIPRSVVGELQFLADNADSDKRARARHGLDVVSELQGIPSVSVHIFADGVRAEEGVDNRLLALAKKHSGSVCTIDYNLNKVAVVEGIEVLNVNELAKSLRMAYLPGERAFIELTQKGNDQQQGVGHLQDGTMVVVEHSYKQIGKTIEVEFIRSLQTAAGKMMFARPVGATQNSVKLPSQSKPKTPQPTTPKGRSTLPKVQSALPRVQPTPKLQSTTPTTQPKLQAEPKVSTNSPVSQNRPANNANKANKGNHRNSRKGKSNEDSMVELANS